MSSRQTREHVAYHEAGHFVAAYVLGFHEEITTVTIVSNDANGSAGENQRRFLGLRGEEAPAIVVRRVMTLYAGRHAELYFDPTREEDAKAGAASDDLVARELLLSMVFPGSSHEQIAQHEEAIRARSVHVVATHWVAIDALARELLRIAPVTGPDATAIVKRAQFGGPASYANWRASIAKAPLFGVHEVPLYSDATIRGQLLGGLGPYSMQFANPASQHDPAFVLIVKSHRDPTSVLPDMQETNVDSFTGCLPGDEIAALVALTLGSRLMAGEPTRSQRPDASGWSIEGDRRRPTFFPRRADRPRVLPGAATDKELLMPGLLPTFPTLRPETASVLVRAARAYRDGLWIAETEPELAWLLLISAIEAVAVDEHVETSAPVDILRRSKPGLVKNLDAASPGLTTEVAKAFARLLQSTARFLRFFELYLPDPPETRPEAPHRLDWTFGGLKTRLQTIYDLRSQALHESIPFPPVMCEGSPFPSSQVPPEKFPYLSTATTGGVWKQEDTPFPLYIFEYLVRGALLKWWDSKAADARVNAAANSAGHDMAGER